MSNTKNIFLSIVFLFSISLQADNSYQISIDFNQSPLAQQENAIFETAFKGEYGVPWIKTDANYNNGDSVCVRAFIIDSITSTRELAGFAIVCRETNNILYVQYICVDEHHQKKGVGRRIMQELNNHFKPNKIELCALVPVVAFYQRLGFSFDPEGTVDMVLDCKKNDLQFA